MPLNFRPFPRDYPAIDPDVPRIAYREILAAPVEVEYTHAKQASAVAQFARVKLRFEPSSRTMSNVFLSEIASGAIPDDCVPAVESAFRAAAEAGPLRGYPVVACRATLVDGAFHETDSSPLAFEIATRAAFREAADRAGMKLLEPYLEVNITTPEALSGSVIGDFNARRGVCKQSPGGPGFVAIYGFAPLVNLIGYDASLRAMTNGATTWEWKPAGLEEVPGDGGDVPFRPAAAKRP